MSGRKQRRASASFATALGHHQAGRLGEAEILYRKVLADDARHADSLHLLGVVAYQTQRHDLSVGLIGRAIALNAGEASYHSNLGNTLRGLGRLDEAAKCYRKAVILEPDAAYAYNNLASVLQQQGHIDEAVACCRKAIELKPDFPEAYGNLGAALKEQWHLDEAVASYHRAIDLKPNFPDAYSNLAMALKEQGYLDEAVAGCRKAIELKPDFPEAHSNLGAALQQQGHLDEAVACFRRAIELKPDFLNARISLAMALLKRGEMAEGWKEFEWRWKTPLMIKASRDFPQPQWRGEPGEGRTLLIHAEQGFGDTLQFCRYAPLAAASGLRIVVEAPKPLVRLLRGLPGVDRVVALGEELPPFDLHCPMLSLPLALGTTLATIPSAAAYLHADAAQVASWRSRLAAMPDGPRIGLVWAGNSRNHSPALAAVDRRRSIAPERLAPLFDVPRLQFFSLQKGGPAASADFPLTDVMAEMDDFADTAALIANLDLVISVDTAVAHLAAALGKPVWLLDRFDSCWRWLAQRQDSPWYPALRLYHQSHAGDWESVVADVARDLRSFASAGR